MEPQAVAFDLAVCSTCVPPEFGTQCQLPDLYDNFEVLPSLSCSLGLVLYRSFFLFFRRLDIKVDVQTVSFDSECSQSREPVTCSTVKFSSNCGVLSQRGSLLDIILGWTLGPVREQVSFQPLLLHACLSCQRSSQHVVPMLFKHTGLPIANITLYEIPPQQHPSFSPWKGNCHLLLRHICSAQLLNLQHL